MMPQSYELLAGDKPEPLFQTEQAYQDFRERFQKEVSPSLTASARPADRAKRTPSSTSSTSSARA